MVQLFVEEATLNSWIQWIFSVKWEHIFFANIVTEGFKVFYSGPQHLVQQFLHIFELRSRDYL
jgi:hypothetical protein